MPRLRAFCLPVFTETEYLEDFDRFVIAITPAYACRLLERHAAVLALTRLPSGADFYEAAFWDPSGEYFGVGEAQRRAPAPTEHVDCQQVVIRRDEICWTAQDKHGNSNVRTAAISIGTLRAIARNGHAPLGSLAGMPST
jgi:hypothetical protein